MTKLSTLVLLATACPAAPVLTVIPVLGPNPHGSSSYAAFVDSTFQALEAAVPAATPSLTIADMLATDYPSWRGTAWPAEPHTNEYGTFLYFALRITSDEPFRLSDVSVTQSSSDPWNYFGYSSATVRDAYAADVVGIARDGTVTIGSADQWIDELLYIGLAAAFDASTYYGYTADQRGLTMALRDYQSLGNFFIDTCYSVSGTSGCAGASVAAPEPAPFGLVAAAMVGVLLFGRSLRH